MAKIISTIKAILTRIFFSAHSLIAIWQVTENTGRIIYWTLCGPLVVLLFEGIFTLMIKKTQEWRWFCPSVFLYLSSIVPAIWLLELDKVERRLSGKTATLLNKTDSSAPLDFAKRLTDIDMPHINEDTWTTLIEQFLMLILIVGRWMLPKGDLTRDQLSQLLLVYIGTAADIIEFFDSYKDGSIAKIPLLVYLTLGIWSWSLLQFTIVLSATRARRSRGSASHKTDEPTECCNNCCCGIDVWGIVLNVILQDAPFLTFRLLIIFQYRIINYMNVFFTCKNSLVIILQMYRLYVVNAEFWKNRSRLKAAAASSSKHYKSRRRVRDEDANSIYMISSERGTDVKRKIKRAKDFAEEEFVQKKKNKKDKKKKRKRKDTGYSTASSQNLYSTKIVNEKDGRRKDNKKPKKAKRERKNSSSDSEIAEPKPKAKHSKASEKKSRKKSKKSEPVIDESSSSGSSGSSNSTLPSYEVINEKKSKSKRRKRDSSSSSSASTDASDNSTTPST